ncbi:unnamed protein product [Soboliphyme baturini]|uniref:Nucleoporin NUP53 n=1 Tax=Soboliphyme baturini TaxID=241478 RepID=A0A183INF1_9BILA|nr:unnamed protein product [Soboliphyme baturini]
MYSHTSPTVEPMVIGNSPSPSAQDPKSPGNRSFLPPYLLGSPGGSLGSTKDATANLSCMFDSGSPFDASMRSSALMSTSRVAGPPVRSLIDDDEQTMRTPGSFLSSSQHKDLTAETCVTVFGFPPQSFDYILQEFGQYGTIVNYETASNGNWMHILYETRMQARRALSKNGKLFGNLKIGVSPCSDQVILRKFYVTKNTGASKIQQFPSPAATSVSSLASRRIDEGDNQSSYVSEDSCAMQNINSRSFTNSKAKMRSLSASYSAGTPAAEGRKLAEDESWVRKLCNNVFGW